jgi:hypothetical protein
MRFPLTRFRLRQRTTIALYDDLSTHQSLSPDGGGDDPECRDRLLFLTTNDEISRWFEVRDAHIC